MRNLVISIGIACLLTSCNAIKENKSTLEYNGIEDKALQFFIDSLLYQSEIFPFEKNDFDSAKLVLPPAIFFDKSVYSTNGLFYDFEIYVDPTVHQLSNVPMDSLERKYSTDSFKKDDKFFVRNYDSLKNSFQSFELHELSKVSSMSGKKFHKIQPEKSLLIEVKGAIEYSDFQLVQLSLMNYYGSVYDNYDLFIVLNDDEIMNWFFD